VARDLTVTGTTEIRWSGRDTTPGAVEDALRRLLSQAHLQQLAWVPGRALNLVCLADERRREEVTGRLREASRNHPSRTILCSIAPDRAALDAVATITLPDDPEPCIAGLAREGIVIQMGECHLDRIETIVNPLVASDLHTIVWAPHGHTEPLHRLLGLAQIALVDSAEDPDHGRALGEAARLSDKVHVVDLAWLRSAMWRHRLAELLGQRRRQPEIHRIDAVQIRYHGASPAPALLLAGWLGPLVGWKPASLSRRAGDHGRIVRGDATDVRLELVQEEVAAAGSAELGPGRDRSGLAAITLRAGSQFELSLHRAPEGLDVRLLDGPAAASTWTALGGIRSEWDLLDEGIHHALQRDPTYRPALTHATALLSDPPGAWPDPSAPALTRT
jgi:glucose-6-phosphate dehydrogenase assembly protein OpcA